MDKGKNDLSSVVEELECLFLSGGRVQVVSPTHFGEKLGGVGTSSAEELPGRLDKLPEGV